MKLTNLTILTVVLALVLMTTGASANNVRPGETVIGQVAGAGAVEVLDIDLAAGDKIKLTAKGKGTGGCAPALEILDPDGDTVAAAADERKLKLVYVAAESGTHQIRLSTDSASAARFTLKVRGDARRSYSSRSGACEFGVRAGSRVDARIKGKGEASLQMYDSAGDDVSAALSGNARKIKARVNAANETGDWSIEFGPEGAKAQVKVRYPAPRGDLLMTMTPSAGGNGSYSPPAAQGDDEEDDEEDPAEPQDPTDPAANDGTVGQPADGTVGNPNDGTVPAAPATPADHGYLTVLLAERSDAELDRLRAELGRDANPTALSVGIRLMDSIDDPIAGSIHEILTSRFEAHEMMDEAGRDAIVDLVADQRRANRAQASLDVLCQAVVGSALDGDAAFDAGRSMAEAELARLNAAIAYALDQGLEAIMRGGADGNAPSRDAVPATNEMVAGLAAIDAAVLSGNIMTQARALDAAAVELADALYAIYETVLSANQAADPNAPATLAAIAQARAELGGLRIEVFGVEFEIALESEPRPSADEPYVIDVLVFGPENAAQAESSIEGDVEQAEIELTENGFRIHMPAHAEARNLIVCALYAGVEKTMDLNLEPEQDAAPAQDVTGRIVDSEGSAIAGVRWEIRIEDTGAVALNAAGQPLMGETGAEGHFVAERVLEGEWILVFGPVENEQVLPLSVEAPDENPQDLGDIVIN